DKERQHGQDATEVALVKRKNWASHSRERSRSTLLCSLDLLAQAGITGNTLRVLQLSQAGNCPDASLSASDVLLKFTSASVDRVRSTEALVLANLDGGLFERCPLARCVVSLGCEASLCTLLDPGHDGTMKKRCQPDRRQCGVNLV